MRKEKEVYKKLEEFVILYLTQKEVISKHGPDYFKEKGDTFNYSWASYLNWLGKNYNVLEETYRQIEMLMWIYGLLDKYGEDENSKKVYEFVQYMENKKNEVKKN